MKALVIADLHGRSVWKDLIEREKPNRVIFLGDYFDSYDISGEEQIRNFQELMMYADNHPEIEFIFMIGNHDYHYFNQVPKEIKGTTSGYQNHKGAIIGHLFSQHNDKLQMAYEMQGEDKIYLFSHAGIGQTFLEKNGFNFQGPHRISDFINDLWKHKPAVFQFTGTDPYGNNMGQTPIWIRPQSLLKDTIEMSKYWTQFVGHTGVTSISAQFEISYMKNALYLLDNLGQPSPEYIIINDGKIEIKNVLEKSNNGDGQN